MSTDIDGRRVTGTLFETGQTVRWRGTRWRVLGEEQGGFLRLVGLDHTFKDVEVTPYLELEGNDIAPFELPLPELNLESSDRSRWRALHRAFLTTMAGGREQLVGLDWGAVTVEPYQLVPLLRVARTMRARLLIADDTGLGKTAEAGIILRWLAQRHQAGRVLIVTRAAPEPQRWRKEMWTKFGFNFDILRDGADFNERRRRAPTVNVFAQERKLIVSMTLAARQLFLDELRQCPTPFDVVIVDEAAHLAVRGNRTKRLALLGRALSAASKDGAMLLLTATPHDGKTESFLSLLQLLDPFVEVRPGDVPIDLASRLVVRRLKTEVTLAGGRKFQEAQIHVVSTLDSRTKEEKALDEPLDAYLNWLADEEVRYESAGARQKATGCQFLAGLYRKRFGSSVAALRATLRRRLNMPPAPEDLDDAVPYVDTDASDPEDDVIDPGAEAETPPPLLSPGEEVLARALLVAAEKVPADRDSKLEKLVELLSGQIDGKKAVVFTEYRDTLRAASRRLKQKQIGFVMFHGGTSDADRENAIHRFRHDDGARVFLATDAASEGINLQHGASNLVHLDVPWNPNRYAQRNGRIDRYGQDEVPHVWALVAADASKKQGRPEARALEIVIEKLQRIEQQLGSVSAVIPGFSTGSVREVLQQAKSDADVQMDALLDEKQGEKVSKDLNRITVRNKRDTEQADDYVSRLGTIDDFEEQLGDLLRTAFFGWDDGGSLEATDPGLLRVEVPKRLRAAVGSALIERATFRRDVAVTSADDAEADAVEFLSPAHPLVAGTLQLLRDEATDPSFPHRFDIEAADEEVLTLSFVVRFVDGEGRTAEEALMAVTLNADGAASVDAEADLERLGIDAASGGGKPDPERIQPWRYKFPDLVEAGRLEIARRAEVRRHELSDLAVELTKEEMQALAVWKSEEKDKVEVLTLGTGTKVSFEAADAFEDRMRALDVEYVRRMEAISDRSDIRLSSVDLLGGRLVVRRQP
ncbi:MAG: DEAD/DEAH box helicase [Actinomycetota bacterium]|nr:DEAD/DEAH box helicase [Actinomycetota bacterium]